MKILLTFLFIGIVGVKALVQLADVVACPVQWKPFLNDDAPKTDGFNGGIFQGQYDLYIARSNNIPGFAIATFGVYTVDGEHVLYDINKTSEYMVVPSECTCAFVSDMTAIGLVEVGGFKSGRITIAEGLQIIGRVTASGTLEFPDLSKTVLSTTAFEVLQCTMPTPTTTTTTTTVPPPPPNCKKCNFLDTCIIGSKKPCKCDEKQVKKSCIVKLFGGSCCFTPKTTTTTSATTTTSTTTKSTTTTPAPTAHPTEAPAATPAPTPSPTEAPTSTAASTAAPTTTTTAAPATCSTCNTSLLGVASCVISSPSNCVCASGKTKSPCLVAILGSCCK